MKFGITAKLFVAVLATNVVTAVAVGLGVRAAFTSGFESYLQEREDQRMARLAGVLAHAYEPHRSWDFLRGNEELWNTLNSTVRPDPPRGAMRSLPPGRPGFEGKDGREGPFSTMPFETKEVRFAGRPPPAVVLDLDEKLVVGPVDPLQATKRRPIEVDGARVGWIAAPVRVTAFDVVDRRFRDEQLRAGWIVAAIAAVLSAIVAGFLARGMLVPVKRLAAATRKLADGEYSTRVPSSSDDELGRLVDDFNRLGNALEKNESSRRNFMADVSHELRTPIAVLKGEIEALQDGVRALTPETLASLQSEVAVLGKLVNDLHDLSLADVGGLAYRFEEVDLGKLVENTLLAFRERFASRGLVVETSLPPRVCVRADPERIGQLVGNLLENSARYTDAGGRLVVSLRAEGSRAVLDLEDSAPGVPEELLPRLFERLFRVETSRNRERGGSGLGLSISRSVAEAHGGSIVARAAKLGGLWIEVRLPLAGSDRP